MIGVSFSQRDQHYMPRLKVGNRQVWLGTAHDAETAMRIRDVAAKWLHGPNAKLNFDGEPPPGRSPVEIARHILAALPLDLLVHRVPLEILQSAGINKDAMVAAGAPIARVALLSRAAK